MATSDALARKMTLQDMVKATLDELNFKAAKLTMSDDQMMATMQGKDNTRVTTTRVRLRTVGAKMRALADAETNDIEPLEALQARYDKMKKLAAKWVNERDQLEEDAKKLDGVDDAQAKALRDQAKALQTRIAQGAIEMQALKEGELGVLENTFDTYKGAYEVEKANLVTAEAARQISMNQAPAMLAALKANQESQVIADATRPDGSDKVQQRWFTDLKSEAKAAAATRRADKEIDRDMKASAPVSVFDKAESDVESAPADIMAEIEAAAKSKK